MVALAHFIVAGAHVVVAVLHVVAQVFAIVTQVAALGIDLVLVLRALLVPVFGPLDVAICQVAVLAPLRSIALGALVCQGRLVLGCLLYTSDAADEFRTV